VSFPPGAVALGNRDLLAARPSHGELPSGSGGAEPRRVPRRDRWRWATTSSHAGERRPVVAPPCFFLLFPQNFIWFLVQNFLAKFLHILFHDVFSKTFVQMFVFRKLSIFLLFIFLYQLVYKSFHKKYSHSFKIIC
jgi:hypothetical protein